jgi:ABC-type Fe3+-hydroxamate transport system substrate-binding protein
MVATVFPAPDGKPYTPPGALFRLTDHRSPFEDRWGGFWVTGTHGRIQHRGNAFAADRAHPSTGPQPCAVKINAPARGIVTLSSHVDEYLYKFLPGERILGVSKDAYDGSFSAVSDTVNKFHPKIVKDAESILRMKPDLVLASDSMSIGGTAELRAAGVPVFAINTTPLTLNEVAANIAALGYVTGEDERAKAEVDRFQGEVEAVGRQCKERHPEPRIFAVSMTGFSYGDHTLFQDIMRLVGATNVAAQNGMHTYQRVDTPTIGEWNPDWVFTWAVCGRAEDERQRWMERDQHLRVISAVKQNRVFVLQVKEVLPLSPLVTGFIHKIAGATCLAEANTARSR